MNYDDDRMDEALPEHFMCPYCGRGGWDRFNVGFFKAREDFSTVRLGPGHSQGVQSMPNPYPVGDPAFEGYEQARAERVEDLLADLY